MRTDQEPKRVGRLVPEPGIAPRPHPDRSQLRQFLRELRLPLSAVQTMLELADVPELPSAVLLALRTAANQTDYLLDLVADYAEIDRLEADGVPARPERLELLHWLDTVLATRTTGDEAANPVRLQHRSFLPSHVDFDGTLAARAIDAVLRVAVQRALPGPIQLRVAYVHDRARPGAGRLVLEFLTRGGGFNEIERGYLYTAFAVRDAASRPLLGLGIAQRLCTLLGGELRVASPGLSACSYQLSFEAHPSQDAHWVDPLAATRSQLGPVRPGRVLFVGADATTRMLLTPGLQRVGHPVDGVDREEHVLGHLQRNVAGFAAVVFDPTCRDETLGGLVDALRGAGYTGRVLRLARAGDASVLPFVDRRLVLPCSAVELLAALTAT
ncbi:MAG: HAMP domain-containing histidine kinase [Planctomycetes bacterium]|nr:HAMP domain-containing histidine kinase [Planctomycetota bacterium]